MGYKTTSTKKALAHLKANGSLGALIKTHGSPDLARTGNAFQTLCRTIVGQQLSTKAAQTIWERFLSVKSGQSLKPTDVLRHSDEALRLFGLSFSKCAFVKDLATKFDDRALTTKKLLGWNDDEIRERLLAVKGIGPWSVDMFLIFALGRMDVLPVGDLGIQKGMQKFFKLKEKPNAKLMEELAEPWRPYRSIASWYMWRLLEE